MRRSERSDNIVVSCLALPFPLLAVPFLYCWSMRLLLTHTYFRITPRIESSSIQTTLIVDQRRSSATSGRLKTQEKATNSNIAQKKYQARSARYSVPAETAEYVLNLLGLAIRNASMNINRTRRKSVRSDIGSPP